VAAVSALEELGHIAAAVVAVAVVGMIGLRIHPVAHNFVGPHKFAAVADIPDFEQLQFALLHDNRLFSPKA